MLRKLEAAATATAAARVVERRWKNKRGIVVQSLGKIASVPLVDAAIMNIFISRDFTLGEGVGLCLANNVLYHCFRVNEG